MQCYVVEIRYKLFRIQRRPLTIADGEKVAKRLGTPYKVTPFFVEFNADGYRCILFGNGRLLIHGLKDMKVGRKLYHQFFG